MKAPIDGDKQLKVVLKVHMRTCIALAHRKHNRLGRNTTLMSQNLSHNSDT